MNRVPTLCYNYHVKIIFLGILSVFCFAGAASAFMLSNFNGPESIVVDPADGSYYVSNVNGDLAAKDGNGYISKINPAGSVVIQKFIGAKGTELDAPKGLVLVGKTIYVTDINAVKGFNKRNGKATALVDLSRFGVKFLNDITADTNGVLYVSDTMTNQIIKIDPRKKFEASVFVAGPELGAPNGLFFNPKNKHLMVVTWESGRLLEIDRFGSIHALKRGLKNLDGIDIDGQGNLFVSNFEKGEIYQIANYGRGMLTTYLTGLTTPADIAYDRVKDELLIPSLTGNTILTRKK